MNDAASKRPHADEGKDRGYSESLALIELQRAHYALRTTLHMLALCGTILSATVFIYLYSEVAFLRTRNDELTALVTNYHKNFVPMAETARTNLETFARANPTLAPILQKYFGTNAPAR